jgi:hypothetical protein
VIDTSKPPCNQAVPGSSPGVGYVSPQVRAMFGFLTCSSGMPSGNYKAAKYDLKRSVGRTGVSLLTGQSVDDLSHKMLWRDWPDNAGTMHSRNRSTPP